MLRFAQWGLIQKGWYFYECEVIFLFFFSQILFIELKCCISFSGCCSSFGALCFKVTNVYFPPGWFAAIALVNMLLDMGEYRFCC